MSTEASSTPPPVRRVFTEEFKREAVRLATERGNISATARELGICDSVLTRWKQRVEKPTTALEATRPFPGRGNARDEEMARLKRELARSQEENAILKKAVGIFTREPR